MYVKLKRKIFAKILQNTKMFKLENIELGFL